MKNNTLKRFWCVCREHGISTEDIYAKVYAEFGTEHISDLDDAALRYMIDLLDGKRTHKPSRNSSMASYRQIALIEGIAKRLGWEDNPARLLGFVAKYAKVDDLQWLTKRQASTVVEGLKKIEARQTGNS